MIAVYRSPGPHFATPGKTYDCKGVSEDELSNALAEGWKESYLEAIGLAESSNETVDNNAPPTRDEMLEQAEKLGIEVDKRWSDKTLMGKISDAINTNPL
jgi:hypothetical protein